MRASNFKMRRPRHEKADPEKQEAFKKFADEVRRIGEREREPEKKPLKVLAFDEARFGLIIWHREGVIVPRGFVCPTSS